MTENNKSVAVAIVIVGILIAGAIYYKPASNPAANQSAAIAQAEALKEAKALLVKMSPVSATEHLLGSLEAPVTIVEYSDLECPYCKGFHRATRTLNEKYGSSGKLALVFRQFPLNIHPKAIPEAVAAECVATLGGNEKFWQYLDQIFEVTPSNNGLDLALLPKLATDLGIDSAKFEACTNDAKTTDFINAEIEKGRTIGVDGTPFVVVINDKGERILPFYEPIPENWDGEARQIVTDMLDAYETELNKLRSE